jgi:hypothetical protein
LVHLGNYLSCYSLVIWSIDAARAFVLSSWDASSSSMCGILI